MLFCAGSWVSGSFLERLSLFLAKMILYENSYDNNHNN